MTIKEFAKGVRSINMRAEIPRIMETTGKELVAYNHDQLQHGILSTGEDIRPYYSDFAYADKKHQQNSKAGFRHPDLKDKGNFYKQFQVSAGFTGIYTIESRDFKAPKLEEKYGKFIFGLTKQNKALYAQGIFYEKLKEYITAKSGLRFH